LIAAISSSIRYLAFLSSSISLVRVVRNAREPDDLLEGVADLREREDWSLEKVDFLKIINTNRLRLVVSAFAL